MTQNWLLMHFAYWFSAEVFLPIPLPAWSPWIEFKKSINLNGKKLHLYCHKPLTEIKQYLQLWIEATNHSIINLDHTVVIIDVLYHIIIFADTSKYYLYSTLLQHYSGYWTHHGPCYLIHSWRITYITISQICFYNFSIDIIMVILL